MIVAVPFLIALIFPVCDTVATFVLELVQRSFVLAPFPLVLTVAFTVPVFPFVSVNFVLFTLRPVTFPATTFIFVVNFAPHPSDATAVILAVPVLTALITPLDDTVATFLLLVVHLTLLPAVNGV